MRDSFYITYLDLSLIHFILHLLIVFDLYFLQLKVINYELNVFSKR